MSNRLQIVLAYVLFIALAYFIAISLIYPFSSQLASLTHATQTANSELTALREKLTTNSQFSSRVKNRLTELNAVGELAVFENQDQASVKLRAIAKQAIDAQSATIQQMRPSNQFLRDGLSWSRLALSFSIDEHRLAALLSDLSQQPSVHVELLSLRKQRHITSVSAKKVLAGNMVLLINYLVKDAQSIFNAQMPNVSIIQPPADANNIVGLFDSSLRLRLQSPSLAYYRLSAITVSNNTQVAVIADVDSKRTRRLKVGDRLDAWKIESITSNGVQLSRDGKTEVLSR